MHDIIMRSTTFQQEVKVEIMFKVLTYCCDMFDSLKEEGYAIMNSVIL